MTGIASDTILAAENLTRKYGAKRALDGIDLSFAGSGITAMLGPNGAGKTTFVHCAMGLIPPSSGRLKVFGAAPGKMASRRRIGVMLQDAALPDQLTAREQITLFATYYPNPIPTDELIDNCSITSFTDKQYKKLSGGQKRRVQFALAILGRPDLIFLDEPTTGLDLDARTILWNTIRDLTSDGASVILTTHYLEEADALADRIVVINNGHVIADGPTSEIRNAVGGAVIQCATSLPETVIRRLPGVRSVRKVGRFTEILTTDATDTLKALFGADSGLSDLTVKKPSLEEAFLELTQGEDA